MASSCQKNCWHCSSIMADKYAYVRGTDTVIVDFIEGGPLSVTSDSLRQLGYDQIYMGELKIPMSFELCNGGSRFHAYRDCYKIK